MTSPEPFAAGNVEGLLHRPAGALADGLVLTHGAGSNREAAILRAVAAAFAEAGVAVLRVDLAFRRAQPKGPPRGNGAADRAGLAEAAAALRSLCPGRLFLGGHSYGGRQASMLAAEQPEIADALLLLSYPLHPPNKPEQLRTQHFPSLRTPSVFVHGPKDGFATEQELSDAVALIPAPTQVIAVAGAGHDLKSGRFDLQPVVQALLGD